MTRLATGGLQSIERPLTEDAHDGTPLPAATLPAPRGRRSRWDAAWDAGAQWNELQHRMQIAWLTAAPDLEIEALEVCDELRLTVAELVGDVDSQDRLRAAVDRCRQGLGPLHDWQWYADELFEENRSIQRELPQDVRGETDVIEEACARLAAYVDREFVELRMAIESQIDERQRQILRLASLVDQAVHPVPAYRQLELETDHPLEAPLSWNDRTTWARPPQESSYLPLDRQALSIPPIDDAWRLEVEQRWEHAGLPALRLPWRQVGEFRLDQAAHDIVAAVALAFRIEVSASEESAPTQSRIVAVAGPATTDESDGNGRVDQAADMSADGQSSGDDAGWSEPGRFGLRFHEESLQVRRGTGDPVSMKGPQQFMLLRELASRDRSIPIPELQHRWNQLGGKASEPSALTIYAAISRLRTRLKPINLHVAKSQAGYKLVEDAVISEQPTDDSQSA